MAAKKPHHLFQWQEADEVVSIEVQLGDEVIDSVPGRSLLPEIKKRLQNRGTYGKVWLTPTDEKGIALPGGGGAFVIEPPAPEARGAGRNGRGGYGLSFGGVRSGSVSDSSFDGNIFEAVNAQSRREREQYEAIAESERARSETVVDYHQKNTEARIQTEREAAKERIDAERALRQREAEMAEERVRMEREIADTKTEQERLARQRESDLAEARLASQREMSEFTLKTLKEMADNRVAGTTSMATQSIQGMQQQIELMAARHETEKERLQMTHDRAVDALTRRLEEMERQRDEARRELASRVEKAHEELRSTEKNLTESRERMKEQIEERYETQRQRERAELERQVAALETKAAQSEKRTKDLEAELIRQKIESLQTQIAAGLNKSDAQDEMARLEKLMVVADRLKDNPTAQRLFSGVTGFDITEPEKEPDPEPSLMDQWVKPIMKGAGPQILRALTEKNSSRNRAQGDEGPSGAGTPQIHTEAPASSMHGTGSREI